MRLLVPLIAALVPLVITPGLLAYFDVTPKIAFLLIGTALILLYRSANIRNIGAVVKSRIGRWWVALLAAEWLFSGIATAFSTHPALSLSGGNWRRFGFLSETALLLFVLVAGAWVAVDRLNLLALLRATTSAGAVAALYGFAQYFGWDPLLPVKAYQAGEGPFTIVRPPGTLGHADYFAAWLVVTVFFGIALERLEEIRWRKIATLACAAVMILAIILSGTRSAMLGLLVGGMVFLAAGRPKLGLRAIVACCALIAAFALFFFSPPGSKLRARLHWSLEDTRGGARLPLWRDSFRMAASRPIQGFGPETFATEFPRYQSVELSRAYPDFYHESPHNMFLDVFTSRGLLGLLPMLALCSLGIRAGLQRRAEAAPLVGGLAAMLVCQQFIVFVVPTALYFYLLVAILAGFASPPGTSAANKRRWYIPVAATLAVIIFVFAIRLVVADAALATVDRRIASADAAGAAAAYQTVLRWQPAGSGSDLRYSRAMQNLALRSPLFATSLKARQEAVQAGIRATNFAEDRANAWYNLANLLAAGNDPVSVERSLRNAIAWSPNWFKPHWTLAQLLELTNRPEDALAEATEAVNLDANHDPEVTATWKRIRNIRPKP
ncbi:MAG TPA: O-antigen ligase family protein [Bryobacteraceae bacterium]|nr:O-antigen ligase family protein [Bryobacteraceae bacterium]